MAAGQDASSQFRGDTPARRGQEIKKKLEAHKSNHTDSIGSRNVNVSLTVRQATGGGGSEPGSLAFSLSMCTGTHTDTILQT